MSSDLKPPSTGGDVVEPSLLLNKLLQSLQTLPPDLQRKVRQQLEAQQQQLQNEKTQRAASAAASAAAMAAATPMPPLPPPHAVPAGISLPPMMPAGIPQPHITYLPQHVPPPQPINFQQMHQQQVQQQFLQPQPQPQQQQQQLMLQPVAAAGGTMPVSDVPVNAPLPAGFGSLSAKPPLQPVYHHARVPHGGATFGLAGQHVSNQAQVMPHAMVPVPPVAAPASAEPRQRRQRRDYRHAVARVDVSPDETPKGSQARPRPRARPSATGRGSREPALSAGRRPGPRPRARPGPPPKALVAAQGGGGGGGQGGGGAAGGEGGGDADLAPHAGAIRRR